MTTELYIINICFAIVSWIIGIYGGKILVMAMKTGSVTKKEDEGDFVKGLFNSFIMFMGTFLYIPMAFIITFNLIGWAVVWIKQII